MSPFVTSFQNVLITLLYMLPAYILCKCKKSVADHLPTLSGILVFLLGPCMIISAMTRLEVSKENLINMLWFFLLTFFLQLICFLLIWLVLKKKFENTKIRIGAIASLMGNTGFFGLPIIQALFPSNPEVQCYSIIFVVSMNIIVFTIGIFCLTGNVKYISLKQAFINPTVLSIIVAFPLYFLQARTFIPTFIMDGVDLLGKMTTPVCMFILGIRMTTIPLKKLFVDPLTYVVSIGKLLVYPLICYAAVYFLPLSDVFKASILILSGTPVAAIVLSLAELYDSDSKFAANCIIISTLMCLFTIPLLSLLI